MVIERKEVNERNEKGNMGKDVGREGKELYLSEGNKKIRLGNEKL